MAKSSLPDIVFILNFLYPDLSGFPSTNLAMEPTAYSSPWFDISKHSIMRGIEGSFRISLNSTNPGAALLF